MKIFFEEMHKIDNSLDEHNISDEEFNEILRSKEKLSTFVPFLKDVNDIHEALKVFYVNT